MNAIKVNYVYLYWKSFHFITPLQVIQFGLIKYLFRLVKLRERERDGTNQMATLWHVQTVR